MPSNGVNFENLTFVVQAISGHKRNNPCKLQTTKPPACSGTVGSENQALLGVGMHQP